MRVVAVPGRLVRDPNTRRVVDDVGIEIDPDDVTWARLIADGDVRDSDAPEPELEPAPAAQAPKE